MSWFDAAGFASIAKSALKEAQRTIDKALDIKDDDLSLVPANTPVDPNNEDFFSTWGISQSGNVKGMKKQNSDEAPKDLKLPTSIWGSFTGSFFDNKNLEKAAMNSLEDTTDIDTEDFSRSKLVVDDTDQLSLSETVEISEDSPGKSQMVEINLDSADSSQNTSFVQKRDKTNPSINRLSIVSCESGKNSGSESVDIITCSTECTTSPESEVLSLGQSISTSSSGLKPTSDSFEVLGESETSPSSIEVIGSNSTNSRRHSQHTDEYVSPLDSPWSEDKPSSNENISPESVEVIPEDQDENSVAEDTMSYTSISESTSATVLDSTFNPYMKPQKMLKDTYTRPDSLSEAMISEVSASPEKNFNFVDAITRAPCRSTMHLPLAQVNQVLIDTQPQSNQQDIPTILRTTNVIDIPHENDFPPTNPENQTLETSIDESSQSDKTTIGSDNMMESSSDTSTTTETSSHSTYLKNMLADAMVEKSFTAQQKIDKFVAETSKSGSLLESVSLSQIDLLPRENSPISSESRSDLVKIGSDQTSGHTSGDDFETTTSSDIEIISGPNGDSSSTHSRQSPAKQVTTKSKCGDSTIDSLLCKMTMKKTKGHTRELSEASSISDDSHSSEVDRLLKRISEMTDILESREFKIADINRRNAELQELNNDLRLQLDSIITKQLETADLSQVTEEYTQRLSALEKKFQQAIREKDSLRKQLDTTKQEAATRLSKSELETLISDKDEIIKELREEGEKLSKQQLQHSNIIKKLRIKEKENESTVKNLRESIDSLSSESERLKKSLAAKEEVERTQIEAVHQLTTKNKKLETEVSKLKEQLDDLTQKYDTVKKSLDAAKKELIDKTKTSSELQMREQMMETLENQKKITESQNEEMMNQLEDLRYKLRQSEEENAKSEQQYRKENNELMLRLEQAEARNEELSQSILEVSRPLVRQLESLQSTHTIKVAAFERAEEELSLKIRELQTKLQVSTTTERAAKEECISLRSKFSEMQNLQTTSTHRIEMLQMQLEQLKTEKLLAIEELNSKIDELYFDVQKNESIIAEQQKKLSALQHELVIEKSTSEMERRQIEALPEHKDRTDQGRHSRNDSNSPTLSLGKASVSDSITSSFWSQDEPFEISHAPRYTNMFEMQTLQSNLKQREGELQQLQWELSRREQERSLLNSEISTLLTRVEELESKTKNYDVVSGKFKEIEQQYDTLCQLYGEKVEENEELKLDLQDVKEMYKGQIDELLRQQRQARGN